MNSYYKVTKLIKDILQANEDVHTVVHGKTEDKDLYKKSIYPLAHINPISSPFTSSQMNEFTFEIAVLDQRDLSKQDIENKFESNDNLIDNLNTCHAVLNNLISTLRLQNNDDMIELTSVGTATPILFKDHNILDGWLVSVTLSIPNNIISVC